MCGGGVPVSGQSDVSVTEGGTGDTLFLSGPNGHGPDTDKQVSLGLHLTAAGGIHDPIPRGCSCACVSYACVRADSSGNSVQMGSTVTKCNAVTKKQKRMVVKNGSGTEIVSSNERYKGETEEANSFIIANVDDVDHEYVNMHLRKRACVSGSTGDAGGVNRKGYQRLADTAGHVGRTGEVDVRPCDNLSVTRKDVQLIVTI